jgi:hypothetical protein
MKQLKAIVLYSALFLFSLIAVVIAQEEDPQQPKKIRKVKRVARPDFSESKDDIYFEDVFSQGLVGQRPESATAEIAKTGKGTDQKEATESSAAGWSTLIDGTTIEDEIKSLNQALARTVTTPVKFKTAYNDVRQTMSLLSMSFAIIREYDAEVRWNRDAAAAQAALQQAATLARSNSDQAFNYCKARKFDLEDLVRGGSFAETEKPSDELDWSEVVGRSETMVRLEQSDSLLKEWTADEKTFAKQKAKIIREAQWVAAIADVIAKEGMDDADVDEYLDFCMAMKTAALQTISATKSDDFDAAGKSANLVSQSCNNCHEDWR